MNHLNIVKYLLRESANLCNLKMVPVVPDMYKALSIHKIRQNTKMPTFYKTLYLRLPQAGESHATIIISLAKGAENAGFDSCGF